MPLTSLAQTLQGAMLLGFETQTPGRELLGAQLQDSGTEKCNCFQVLETQRPGDLWVSRLLLKRVH